MYTIVEANPRPEDHEPAFWLLADPNADPKARSNLIPNIASFVLGAAVADERTLGSTAAILSTLKQQYVSGRVREDFMEIFESTDSLDRYRSERIKTITQMAMQGPFVEAALDEIDRLQGITGDHFDWANNKGYLCVIDGAVLVPYLHDLTETDRAKVKGPALDPRIDTHVLAHKLNWSGDNTPPTQPKYNYETVFGQYDEATRTFHEIERRDTNIF